MPLPLAKVNRLCISVSPTLRPRIVRSLTDRYKFMPGLCLIATQPNTDSSAPLLAEMLRRMKHFPWYREETHQDAAAGIALGRLSLGFVNAGPQPVGTKTGRPSP